MMKIGTGLLARGQGEQWAVLAAEHALRTENQQS